MHMYLTFDTTTLEGQECCIALQCSYIVSGYWLTVLDTPGYLQPIYAKLEILISQAVHRKRDEHIRMRVFVLELTYYCDDMTCLS